MDIVALKTFLEVAKTHHFGHAAENLFVSQSTVSARIRTLEEQLGVTLFIRQRRNIHLSNSGEALIPHAKSIVTMWDRFSNEIGKRDDIQNVLAIGGLPGLWDTTLQEWLSMVSNKHTELTVSADSFSQTSLVQRVMDGSMDIAFLYDATNGLNLISQPLKTVTLRLVSSSPTADAIDAFARGYVKVHWGLNFAVEFAANFPETPPAKLVTGLGQIASTYLQENDGSAYLPESEVSMAVKSGDLYFVPNAPIYNQENGQANLIQSLIKSL